MLKDRTELINRGCRRAVKAVPAEPKDKYAERTERNVVTRKSADLYDLAVFVPLEFADTRSQNLRADKRRDTAYHMNCAGACKVVEAERAQPSAAPNPVRFNGINHSGNYAGINAVGQKNFVLSAIAPDTIVAVVAQKTRLNTKLENQNSRTS